MTATATELQTILVRYGAVPEVGRFRTDLPDLPRGCEVVLHTHRGLQIGTVLDAVRNRTGTSSDDESNDESVDEVEPDVLRMATDEDLALRDSLRGVAEAEFDDWCRRIVEWNVELDLLDLEWTLDHDKRILYVLSDRGPGSTQLALQAAAAGLGIIEVQPVASDGPIPIESGGGCGTGGGGCGCSH